MVNNLLHSLISQCTIYLNGTQNPQTTELYPYSAYIETLVTYGNDAANSHLTMPFWLLDEEKYARRQLLKTRTDE